VRRLLESKEDALEEELPEELLDDEPLPVGLLEPEVDAVLLAAEATGIAVSRPSKYEETPG